MKIKKQRYYNCGIAVDVFFDPEKKITDFRKAAIVINGFPDFIGINPLTKLLVSSDNLVFQPHMAGTFDSDYLFSPDGAYKTFKALNNLVNHASGANMPSSDMENLPWKINSVLLTGHSFGGFFALRYFNLIENLDKILFTSSVFHYANKYGCLEIGIEQYAKVANQYPYTYRLADINEWKGMWEGKDQIPIRPIGSVKEILIIYGENDKYFNIELINKNLLELVRSYIFSNTIEKAGHPLIELLDNPISIDSIKELALKEF